jgi:hypothetical protein
MSSPIVAAALAGRLGALLQAGARSPGGEEAPLLTLATQGFEVEVLEALLRAREATPGGDLPADPAPEPAAGPAAAQSGGLQPAVGPGRETGVIAREAERTGVDPSLLVALRHAENGGPGREFGVLAASAPTLEAQARVAANTIRNTASRYREQGGTLLDPVSGRYTEGFLRFLSARYAPVGAANDPGGLNRHHAGNLIALYRRAGVQDQG